MPVNLHTGAVLLTSPNGVASGWFAGGDVSVLAPVAPAVHLGVRLNLNGGWIPFSHDGDGFECLGTPEMCEGTTSWDPPHWTQVWHGNVWTGVQFATSFELAEPVTLRSSVGMEFMPTVSHYIPWPSASLDLDFRLGHKESKAHGAAEAEVLWSGDTHSRLTTSPQPIAIENGMMTNS